VATAVGGIPDLVGDAAVLIPPGDDAALADAVLGLLTDPARAAALAQSGLLQARTWPDEAATAHLVLQTYAELLETPS
jgi:glycosyltransferase involved in cell wall biosynthesis